MQLGFGLPKTASCCLARDSLQVQACRPLGLILLGISSWLATVLRNSHSTGSISLGQPLSCMTATAPAACFLAGYNPPSQPQHRQPAISQQVPPLSPPAAWPPAA